MDFQTRFAIFTAVGLASFSAGLSLTTACQRHDVEPEKMTIHPALPTEDAPAPSKPLPAPAALDASKLAVAPKPATKPASANEALAADQISVRRLMVTHAVADREPVEPAELVAGTPVLAFVELSNKDAIERNVVVTFEREGRDPVGHVKLHVPANTSRFRTWARTKNLGQTGTWEAVIRGDDGKELGRQPFELLDTLDPA